MYQANFLSDLSFSNYYLFENEKTLPQTITSLNTMMADFDSFYSFMYHCTETNLGIIYPEQW